MLCFSLFTGKYKIFKYKTFLTMYCQLYTLFIVRHHHEKGLSSLEKCVSNSISKYEQKQEQTKIAVIKISSTFRSKLSNIIIVLVLVK